jgi:hypothetical protein
VKTQPTEAIVADVGPVAITFDGAAHVAGGTPLLPAPDRDGWRHAFHACCDCGLVHVFHFGPNGEWLSERLSEEDAARVRAKARAAGATFPLSRSTDPA